MAMTLIYYFFFVTFAILFALLVYKALVVLLDLIKSILP